MRSNEPPAEDPRLAEARDVVTGRTRRLTAFAAALVVVAFAAVTSLNYLWYTAVAPPVASTEAGAAVPALQTSINGWDVARLGGPGAVGAMRHVTTMVGLLAPVGWLVVACAGAVLANRLRSTIIAAAPIVVALPLGWKAFGAVRAAMEDPRGHGHFVVDRAFGNSLFEFAFFAGAFLLVANLAQIVHVNRAARAVRVLEAEAAGQEVPPSLFESISVIVSGKATRVLRELAADETDRAPAKS